MGSNCSNGANSGKFEVILAEGNLKIEITIYI